MTKVTNSSKVVRGVVILDGGSTRTVHLKPGKSITADFDEAYLAKLSSRDAFKVEDGAGPGEGPELHRMKVDDLKVFAEEHGMDLGDATKKDDIIAAIEIGLEA